jgi:GTP-binding protein Era
MAAEFRCGLVAIVGPPNSGKSTLLNALVGEKISIVAPKPQTTRLNVRGMVNQPGLQLVFTDTPGLLKPTNALESSMRRGADSALHESDSVLVIVSPDTEKDFDLAEGVQLPAEKSILVINKADAYSRDRAFEMAVRLQEKLKLTTVLNISAKKKEGLDTLLKLLAERAPIGEAMFPEEDLSDMDLRQTAAELIREKALMITRDEVPHSLAVAIERYHEREDGLHEVEAVLFVERESQKGIVIGAGGLRLKQIGQSARQDLERLAGAKVFLKLWVKVAKDWKKDPAFLKSIGMNPGEKSHESKSKKAKPARA